MNYLLSIIIPFYNEEKRIHNAFVHLEKFLKTYKFNMEIIFVDDGSRDNSNLEVRSWKLEKEKKLNTKIQLISYQSNQGKGYAVKTGVLAAQGKWILVVDADMSIPLSEFKKFTPYFNRDSKMLVGTRNEISRRAAHQGLFRRRLSNGFRVITKLILNITATDITCGFKCFEKVTGQKIFRRIQTKRWAYDAELFFLAQRIKIPIIKIPISWKEDERTRVNIIPAMTGSLIDLVKIRLRSLN